MSSSATKGLRSLVLKVWLSLSDVCYHITIAIFHLLEVQVEHIKHEASCHSYTIIMYISIDYKRSMLTYSCIMV